MFTCTRKFSMKVKEKIDFSIQFHATQVPNWDKLAVSLIPLDTGRVTGKTRKVPVCNGQCHWLEAITETSKLSLDIRTLQYDEKLYKFVVSKGYSRSGILGEVIINLAEYVSAASPSSITLPLRFCYAGTVLHVTIQCLTPRSSSRVDLQRSSSKRDELISEDESEFSTPLSHNMPSERRYIEKYKMPKHSSTSIPETEPLSPVSTTGSVHSFQNKTSFASISYVSLTSPVTVENPAGLKSLENPAGPKSLESDLENTLLQLHNETMSWKSIAEAMQNENKVQNEKIQNMRSVHEHEKCSLLAERDNLKAEIELRENALKEELGFEREANSSLSIQLQKLQSSNMELLLAVRDLEDLQREVAGHDRVSDIDSTEKRIDTIIIDGGDDEFGLSPDRKVLITGLVEDLKNVRVLLNELVKHPDAVGDTSNRLLFNLEALVRGSQSLIGQVEDERNFSEGATSLESLLTRRSGENVDLKVENGLIQELQAKSTVIEELDSRVFQLEAEKQELESRLNSYMKNDEHRKLKMNELEAQVWEFAKELDYVQASNDSLEAMVAAMKEEKEELLGVKTDSHLAEQVEVLEARAKSMEEERDAYHLERCVFENLARDLCEQVQSVLQGTLKDEAELQNDRKEQRQDFIYHVKELRTAFSSMLKAKEETEIRFQELHQTCVLLEARAVKEHSQLVSTIATLDVEFGHLSKQSDQMLEMLNQEVGLLLSKVEQDEKNRKSQSFLRVAAEENACEIAYLRNEVHKLRSQNETLLQHSSFSLHESEEMSEVLKRFRAEKTECEARLEVLAGECDCAKMKELETSKRLEIVTKELQVQTGRGESMKEQVSILDGDIKCLEVGARNLKSENTDLRTSFQNLGVEHANLLEHKRATEEKLLALESSLKESNMLKEKFKEQLETERSKAGILWFKYQEESRENNELLNCYEMGLHHAKMEAKDKLTVLSEEIHDFKHGNADLRHFEVLKDALLKKLACCETKLEIQMATNQELEKQKMQLEQENDSLAKSLASLEADLLREREESLAMRNNDLANVKGEMQGKLDDLVRQLQSSEQISREKLVTLEGEYKNTKDLMETEREAILKDFRALRQENVDLKRQLHELDFMRSSLEAKLMDLHKSVEAELISLEEGLGITVRTFEDQEQLLAEKVQRLEADYKVNFEAQLEQWEHTKGGLQNELKELRAKELEARNACLLLKRENEDLELKAADWKTQSELVISKLQAEVLTFQAKMHVLEENEVYIKSTEASSDARKQASKLEKNKEMVKRVECSSEVKPLRRKWRETEDEPPGTELQNLRATLMALENEHASKSLELNLLLEKSRERESVLCEKIVRLELSRRAWDDSEDVLSKALAEVEHLKQVKANLEETTTSLKALLETTEALHREKAAECSVLEQENEALKQAIADWKMDRERFDERTETEYHEREALLLRKIEFLEMATDAGTEQLKNELTRLQYQNSEFTRREHELLSKLNTQELLESELHRLQEENELLGQKLLKLKEDSLWGDTLERLMCLETELAEALETNNMYKLQLQSIFSKHQNTQTAAVDEVIESLMASKKQIWCLEAELKEMQDRYLGMSMRFAEMHSEREELVMTVKALRTGEKSHTITRERSTP